MRDLITFYRVYDSSGEEIFASKNLNSCCDFVLSYSPFNAITMTIRKIDYELVDNGALVIGNEEVKSDVNCFNR